ncbi:hypothetical protein PF008_g25150 [Phytophthora fragariae]|uniref:Uncharacterized protein n=1 Tax=Phytophthora fragariae TaxID=53985 RepID=A0A6G0QKX9_9STRA|nr:hypothetical protein PF008_g25150 [Phytophthora fragariae]
MQPSDNAEAVESAAPPFAMPLPLAWSDLIPGWGSTAFTPAPPPAHATKMVVAPESAKAKSGRGPRGASDPAPSSSSKGKAPARRMKWTNGMICVLLRFADGDVKRRLEAVDTKTMKALSW